MPLLWQIILGYLLVINILAIIITIWDKGCAKAHASRIPEATLLWIAALGGSVSMFLTMQLIRHKTRKLKFMIGIPVIIVLQIGMGLAVYFGSQYL